MNKKHALIGVMALSLFFITCKKDDSSSGDETNTTSGSLTAKEQAAKDYADMYTASSVSNFSWNGNADNCTPGTLSQEVLDKTMLRIKYFRKVCGLPNSTISMEAALNAKCQQNALMIRANNKISHFPDNTWKCFTQDGADAAGNGNISFGTSDVRNIDAWMKDDGSNNGPVGHRRWILFSMASKFGFGCTESSGTLWVINDDIEFKLPAGTPEFIAWPAKGYIPRQLIYPRWSFSVPGASFPFQVDFTDAVVTMKDPAGADVTLNVIHRTNISNSYVGDNAIVWEPSGVNVTSAADQKYTVTVSNVKVNGATKTYTYDVNIFNP